MNEMSGYKAGDEVAVGDVTVVLGTRKGSAGIRWTWYAPAAEVGAEMYLATPDAAIEHAFRTLGGPRCHCGDPATMRGSTIRTCPNHFA